MAINRSGEGNRVSNTAELREQIPSRRTPGKTSARDPAAAPFDTDDEAAGRPAPREAIERALEQEQASARRDVRAARSPGAIGPIGRPLLLIVVLALVALFGVLALLAF